MGKAQRTRQQTARARIAAQQAEQRAAEKRRRMLAIGGITIALLAVLGIIIGAVIHNGNKAKQAGVSNGTLPASVQANLTVPPSVLAQVGIGSSSASGADGRTRVRAYLGRQAGDAVRRRRVVPVLRRRAMGDGAWRSAGSARSPRSRASTRRRPTCTPTPRR